MGLLQAGVRRLSVGTCRRFHFICCIALALAICASTSSGAVTPPFYKISGDGAEAYLLGSIHVGQDDWYPLPAHIQDAFNQCGRLAVELDVDAVDATGLRDALRREARLEEGQSLFDLLPSDLYFGLDQALYPFDIHLVDYNDTEPWFFLLILSSLGFAGTDYSPDEGVDVTLIRKAKAAGKEVIPLETIEQQIGAFAGFDMATQIELLKGALDAGSGDTKPEDLVDAWQRGDDEALERLLSGPDNERSVAEEAFRQALVVKRNQLMADGIDKRLKGGECLFVVVGALHIVGADSIPELLEERGYAVTRLNPQPKVAR